jgi:hypothetical protein
LPLQILFINKIMVHNSQPADTSGSKMLKDRTPETACPDYNNGSFFKQFLPSHPYFRDQDLPAVSSYFALG